MPARFSVCCSAALSSAFRSPGFINCWSITSSGRPASSAARMHSDGAALKKLQADMIIATTATATAPIVLRVVVPVLRIPFLWLSAATSGAVFGLSPGTVRRACTAACPSSGLHAVAYRLRRRPMLSLASVSLTFRGRSTLRPERLVSALRFRVVLGP